MAYFININIKISNEKLNTWEVQTGASTYPQRLLPLLSGCRKKETCLAIRALLIPSTPTPPTSLLHPPTTTYMPRSACKQSNTYRCWLARLGEGAGLLKLAGYFTSQRAQSSCQSALPAFIRWNSENIPLQGVYGAASNNRYQKPPAWNCPLAMGRVSPVRRDQRETASIWGLSIQRQLSLLTLSFC